MKGLLVALFIGIFIFVGCSKNDEDTGEESIPLPPNIMEIFDISPNDTIGLRIFGLASINTAHGISILGNKNGYLWVQILEPQENNIYKKITNFTTTAKFNDRIEIDLGYGEKTVIKANYINWDMEIKWGQSTSDGIDIYTILFHDRTHFLLNEGTFSWIICENKILEKQINFGGVIANGYIGWFNDNEYVCDETGEPLYKYDYEFKNYTFINIYEYINYSPIRIYRRNAKTGATIWESRFENIGQIIDGHEPKIEQLIEIKGDIVLCTFNITNYDGSKETKNINLNIETGEIIEK